jgi:hypothetical protein
MEKIEIILDKDNNEYVLIDRGNGEYTSMLKSTYDAQQVAQATLASELSNPSTPQAGA